jgi:hypothetical protein
VTDGPGIEVQCLFVAQLGIERLATNDGAAAMADLTQQTVEHRRRLLSRKRLQYQQVQRAAAGRVGR